MIQPGKNTLRHEHVTNVMKRTLWLALALTISVPATAAVGYQLGAAANHSDNIFRVPTDTEDDVVYNLSIAALWRNNSPRLTAEAFGQLSYLSYENGSFDDDTYPAGYVQLDWNILPARLSWILEDRFGQIASDPFGNLTPDNIENTNILRTGPDLTFGPDPSRLLTLSARFEDQKYEIQPIDNQRLSGAVRWQRQASVDRTFAVTAVAETVDFDEDTTGTDYDIYEAYVTFERSLSQYHFELDAGGTLLDIEGETADGLLARLTTNRNFGSNWVLEVTGEYSFTDSGSRFLIGREQSSAGPGQSVDDDNLAASGSPLRLRSLLFNATHLTPRRNLDFLAFWESERYALDSQFDREQIGGSLTYSMSINPLNLVLFTAYYKQVDFETVDRQDDIIVLELLYRRNLNKNLSLDFRIARLERTSTDPGSEFLENVFGINLTYASDIISALRRRAR